MPEQVRAEAKSQDDLSRALIRGTATGLIVPLGTVPFDRVATNFQINSQHALLSSSTWSQMLDQPTQGYSATRAMRATWQGYPFTAKTNVFRYGLTYITAPMVEACLRRRGLDEDKSRVVGNTVAGGLDGMVSGVFSPIKQYYFTDPTKTHEVTNMLDKAARKNLTKKSLVAMPYVVARNTMYWPLYNEIVLLTEKKLTLDEDKEDSLKKEKEFLAGAMAGLATTVVTYPFDALRTRHIHRSDQSFKEMIASSYQEFGFKALYKVGYRGLFFSVFRAPVAMGLTNLAKHAADCMYKEYKQAKIK